MERKRLREAREARGWSQEEFASRFETIQREAISNWERGKDNPYGRNKREAATILGWTGTLDELFALTEDETRTTEEETDEQSISIRVPPMVQSFLCNRLWHIAHTSYRAPSEMTAAIVAVIEEFDAMNTGYPTYEITRREALCSLASLPMTTLGQNPRITASHYTEMLMHCTAALEACWELYRGGDPTGAQYAYECCCTYVPLLKAVVRDSSHHRKQALDLAARYAILQTLLGWECAKPWELVRYAQNARDLSKEAGNISLQLSAYSKLSWSYLTSKRPANAWKTMQEGEQVLKDYQRARKNGPLPSGIVGNFYSGYAVAQVDNGIAPDLALGIATDSEPLDKPIAFTEYSVSSQWLEAARVCSAKGDFKQAIMWVGRRIDLETLSPRVPQSKRGQIHAINILTTSLLQSKERDLSKIISAWMAGMEGAQTLRHEGRYQDALTNFEIIKALYPGERRIMKLVPLTSHW